MIAGAIVATCGLAQAAIVNINALDIRSSGVFGHPNVSGVTLNGAAPAAVTSNILDFAMTYSGLDLDGDSTANDSVTFTLRFSGSATQRAFDQGIDTGFGTLNGVTLSMLSVSGTTTDNGDTIVFDGFTGGAIGVGGNGDLDRTATINGNPVAVNSPNTGVFQFITDSVDFGSPTATIVYDNSGGTFGSIVARNHDLQFSTVPEPATIGLVAAFGGAVLFIRRRFMI